MAEYNSREDIDRVVGWAQAELDVLSLKRAAIAMRVRVIKNTIVGLADVFGSTLTDEELRTLPPTLLFGAPPVPVEDLHKHVVGR